MPYMTYAITERLTLGAGQCMCTKALLLHACLPRPAPARGIVVTEILLCKVPCEEAADPLMYWSDGNVLSCLPE